MAIKDDNVQNPLARFAKSAPQTAREMRERDGERETSLTQNNFKKLKKEMPKSGEERERERKWQQNYSRSRSNNNNNNEKQQKKKSRKSY